MEGDITIILGGQPRKLKFSMWAIEKNQELLAENRGPIHYSTTANTTAIIYAGLANQYRIEKKELDFNLLDVTGWVYDLFDSDTGFEQIDTVVQAFTTCNAYKNLQKNNEDKKKSNGMMSTASLSVSSD